MTDEEAGLPPMTDAGFELLRAQLDASYAGVDAGDGAAANPPPDGSVCDNDPGTLELAANPTSPTDTDAGCLPINVQPAPDCYSDDQCTNLFGAGFYCRQMNGRPELRSGRRQLRARSRCNVHRARSACMQLLCADGGGTCDQRDICEAGTEFDAGDNAFGPPVQTITTNNLFAGDAAPDAAPHPTFQDDAGGVGPNHTWCSLLPQNPGSVKPASGQPPPGGTGSSGGNGTPPDLLLVRIRTCSSRRTHESCRSAKAIPTSTPWRASARMSS